MQQVVTLRITCLWEAERPAFVYFAVSDEIGSLLSHF